MPCESSFRCSAASARIEPVHRLLKPVGRALPLRAPLLGHPRLALALLGRARLRPLLLLTRELERFHLPTLGLLLELRRPVGVGVRLGSRLAPALHRLARPLPLLGQPARRRVGQVLFHRARNVSGIGLRHVARLGLPVLRPLLLGRDPGGPLQDLGRVRQRGGAVFGHLPPLLGQIVLERVDLRVETAVRVVLQTRAQRFGGGGNLLGRSRLLPLLLRLAPGQKVAEVRQHEHQRHGHAERRRGGERIAAGAHRRPRHLRDAAGVLQEHARFLDLQAVQLRRIGLTSELPRGGEAVVRIEQVVERQRAVQRVVPATPGLPTGDEHARQRCGDSHRVRRPIPDRRADRERGGRHHRATEPREERVERHVPVQRAPRVLDRAIQRGRQPGSLLLVRAHRG